MICKALIEVVVLFDDQEVEPEFFGEATLADIERLIEDEAIGLHDVKSIAAVKPEDLKTELLAIGNDGAFFDPI